MKRPAQSCAKKCYISTESVISVIFYLKLWPIRVHAWAMVVAEPPQVFLRTGRGDGSFKLPVNWGIAAKNKNIIN